MNRCQLSATSYQHPTTDCGNLHRRAHTCTCLLVQRGTRGYTVEIAQLEFVANLETLSGLSLSITMHMCTLCMCLRIREYSGWVGFSVVSLYCLDCWGIGHVALGQAGMLHAPRSSEIWAWAWADTSDEIQIQIQPRLQIPRLQIPRLQVP